LALNTEGRATEVRTGDICFIDLSRPISLRAPDYNSLTLILPRAMLEPHVADIDSLHGRVLQKSSPLNAMLGNHLRTLFAEAPELSLADGQLAASGTAALIAAFAGPSAQGHDTIARTESATPLQVMRRFIETNLHHSDLGPDFICQRFGVSRAKLYRVFEPMGGVSHYILQRRLSRAYQLITDPSHADLRVSAIATRCGFGNVSAFSRAFSQAYGMSPTELRGARDELADFAFSGEGAYGTMSRWLLGLDAAGK
jgi:AraC-like DNA-binding protein